MPGNEVEAAREATEIVPGTRPGKGPGKRPGRRSGKGSGKSAEKGRGETVDLGAERTTEKGPGRLLEKGSGKRPEKGPETGRRAEIEQERWTEKQLLEEVLSEQERIAVAEDRQEIVPPPLVDEEEAGEDMVEADILLHTTEAGGPLHIPHHTTGIFCLKVRV